MKLRSLLLAAVASLLTGTLVAVADLAPGINSTANTVWTMVWEAASTKPTYSATKIFSPPSAATDVCSISGSATKTIRVREIYFGGMSGAIVAENIGLVRRTVAYGLGNGTALTTAAWDTSSPATTVNMAEAWTGVPTLTANNVSTVVSVLMDQIVWFGNTTTGLAYPQLFRFGPLSSSIQLRGIAQNLAINMNGQGANGSGTIECTFVWTEE